MTEDKHAYLEEMAKMVEEILLGMVKEHVEAGLSDKPVLTKKTIHEYEGRMRVSALDKFEGPGYVGAVNFFLSEKHQQKHEAAGVVVLYISGEEIEPTIKKFGKKVDEEESDQCAQVCAEICAGLSDRFNSKLASAGYPKLILSKPVGRRNDIAEGINFSFDQYDKYEVAFSDKGKSRIFVDVTMKKLR